MRSWVIGWGLIVGTSGIFMAHVAAGHGRAALQDARQLEAKIVDLQQKISVFQELKQEPPISLDAAYVSVMNSMNVLARIHHVACAMGMQGTGDGGLTKNAYPFEYPGLREVGVQGVCSGFSRRDALLSVLDALSCLEDDLPVLMRSMTYEKNSLVFELAIVGL